MTLPLIAGIAVILLIVIIAVTQRSGPRITTIERKVENKEEDEQ